MGCIWRRRSGRRLRRRWERSSGRHVGGSPLSVAEAPAERLGFYRPRLVRRPDSGILSRGMLPPGLCKRSADWHAATVTRPPPPLPPAPPSPARDRRSPTERAVAPPVPNTQRHTVSTGAGGQELSLRATHVQVPHGPPSPQAPTNPQYGQHARPLVLRLGARRAEEYCQLRDAKAPGPGRHSTPSVR